MRLGPMARVQGTACLLRYVRRARQLSLASVLIAAALRLACQLITRNQWRQWRRRRRHRAPALNGVRSEGTPVVRPNALAVGVVWVAVVVSSAVTPGDLAAAAPIAPRQWLQAPNAVTEGRVGLRRLRCRSSGHGREQHETKRPQHPGARSGPARRAPHKRRVRFVNAGHVGGGVPTSSGRRLRMVTSLSPTARSRRRAHGVSSGAGDGG